MPFLTLPANYSLVSLASGSSCTWFIKYSPDYKTNLIFTFANLHNSFSLNLILIQMVLPIFNEKKKFIGSATVIENDIILTAAHNFFSDDNNAIRVAGKFFIRYKNEFIELPDPLFEEFVPKAVATKYCEEYADITIFKAPHSLKLAKLKYKLHWPSSVAYNVKVDLIGFCDDRISPNTSSGLILDSRMAVTNVSDNDSINKTFKNCFRISNFLCDGYSGGAVLLDNCCIGIIVFGTPKKTASIVALKASWISSLLQTIKH